MKDDFLNFTEKAVLEDNPTPISLVIPDVPSKVAYEILTRALATGEGVSPDEMCDAIEKRVYGSTVSISFDELKKIGLFEKYKGEPYREEIVSNNSDDYEEQIDSEGKHL